MNEISALAQRLKQRSNKTTEAIETTLQNDLRKLHESFMINLSESEATIRQGMASLDESKEKLQQQLKTNQQSIDTSLTAYSNNIQAHLNQNFTDLREGTEALIESHANQIEQLIRERESSIARIIRSEMKSWGAAAGIVALSLLILGIVIGAVMVNRFSKPTYILQQPQVQQPINYRQR